MVLDGCNDGNNARHTFNVKKSPQQQPQPQSQSQSQPIDITKIKKTNRLIRSCTNCKRRKVKCNFEIPCDRCIARNQGHLCTRETVIFDGMLINNNNQHELKFSQENEILKKKIKELQAIITELKSQELDLSNEKISKNNISSNNSNSNNSNSNKNNTNNNNSNNSKKRSYAQSNKIDTQSKKKYTAKTTSNLKELNEWNRYTFTITRLKEGLGNGLILDNSTPESLQMDYNTEDWLTLKDKKFVEYDAQDSRAKCWQYELEKIRLLKKSVCDILVKNGLKISILKPIFDIDAFWKDYDEYWSNERYKEKHITIPYSKTSKNYLFLSLMYSLMCLGVYQCSDDDAKLLGFSDNDWDTYSKGLFAAALETLYRGRYMTHPNIRSIQIITLLRSLSGLLGGNVLGNSLTCVSYFLAYQLNLFHSTNTIQQNIFWEILTYDWYDTQDRFSLIKISNFQNLPKPSKWKDPDEKVIDWSNFYLRFTVDIAIIKKTYYSKENEISLNNLKKGDLELRFLEVELFKQIDEIKESSKSDHSIHNIEFVEFSTKNLILHEVLELNILMSSFLTYEEWLQKCYDTCYNNSIQIITMFVSTKIPLQYKFFGSICDQVVYAVVFLIVDTLLDNKHFKNQKSIKILVRKCINVFKSFKFPSRCASRGMYVFEKLISLINQKQKTKGVPNETIVNVDKVTAHNSRVDISNLIQNEVEQSNPVEQQEVSVTEKFTENYVPSNYNNDKGCREDSEESTFDSDSSSESDDDLYCSGMIQQKEVAYKQKLAQFESEMRNNQFNTESISDTNTLQHNLTDLNRNILNNLTNPEINPTNNNTLDKTILTPFVPDQCNDDPNQVHDTIMDILKDSGWMNFMNSIDDLKLPYD